MTNSVDLDQTAPSAFLSWSSLLAQICLVQILGIIKLIVNRLFNCVCYFFLPVLVESVSCNVLSINSCI